MDTPITVAGNNLTLLTEGPARLDALVALIDGATTSLRLLYYVYSADGAGQRVHNALVAAAARGVQVALIVDGFGSDVAGQDDFFEILQTAGIDVSAFHPRWGRRYLLRNHQKLALADEARALVGGFNIGDDYFAEHGDTAWRDLGLLIDGDAVVQLVGYFDTLQRWIKTPRTPMRALRKSLRRWSNPEGAMRWLLGGPVRRLSPWARAVRTDLIKARRLSMIAAYFAPNPAMLRRLDRIGMRGSARIVTASKTDNLATIGAARWTYAGLLRKRVRIFEYQPLRLHTKLIVVDDAVYIGSANFDMRSLFLNLEIMLRVEDAGFAAHVERYIDGEIAQSSEMTLAEFTGWHRWPSKLRWALCYFVVAVLDYNVTRRLNIGVG
ncbi:MAG: phospholipase D-like domain-containing protein [Sphingomonadaceae bacterium]